MKWKIKFSDAITRVCCTSDVQVKEKQDRIIGSVNSVRGAIKNGIIPDGGIALEYASLLYDPLKIECN